MDANSKSSGELKAATRDGWDRAAKGWSDHAAYLHAWLADATEAMLEQAEVRPGSRVLDVAAGAGDQTLDIARRVGPAGSVLATDISGAILQLALENARQAGLSNVETKTADAESLGLGGAGFDAAICRLGLMFCPDPAKALREVRAALKPGGRLSALVFSEPQNNPCIGILFSTAHKHAGLPPPDPYRPGALMSLSRPGLIDRLFREAGFGEVTTTRISAPFRLPSAKAYLAMNRAAAAPLLQVLSPLDEAAKEAAWAEMEERLNAFQKPSGWVGPNELLLIAGRC